jgi:exonuclease SbcD
MLKIAHLSDMHVNARGRLADLGVVLNAFLEDIARQQVDLILCSGDFYERRSVPEERTFLADFLQRAATIAPIAGARGNHDAPGELEILNRLETECPIYIADRATAGPESAWSIENRSGSARFGILALPWVEKAHLAGSLGAEVDAETGTQLTIAAIRDLLTCLGAETRRVRADGAIPLLVTHVMLGGSVVSNGQILIGQGVELSPSDLLAVGCEYVAAGHIHATQAFFGGRVAYAGSPDRHDFGEKEAKGYRLITLDDEGRFVSNEFKELPARRMLLLEGTLDPEKLVIAGACDVIGMGAEGWDRAEVDGALVRFRYHVRAQDLHLVDDDAIERALRADGAVDVQIEAVVEHENRVRSTEISAAATTWEKADAFFKAKGVQLEDAQRERLQSKLGELEGAHA